MKFYCYQIYDKLIKAWESSITFQNLEPEEMAEQYRRALMRTDAKQYAMMTDKEVYLVAEFNDLTGELKPTEKKVIFEFPKGEVQ